MIRKCVRLGRHAVTAAALVGCVCPVVSCQSEPHQRPTDAASPIVAPGSRGHELYVSHCAACHGRRGRGNGIAAVFLGVPPRDLRAEAFRYVSTLDGTATQPDLTQTIAEGRLQGQMPAAPWLTDDEVALLANYVRELNRLGWVERLTREFAGDPDMTQGDIEEIAAERVAPGPAISVTPPSHNFRPDMRIGRELYDQSCASCHGPTGRGDGLDKPLDELGRSIKVRDLTRQPIRGGSDPFELFKRIRCGIPGTPMPAQPAMTNEQAWQLIFYTRHLAGKPLNW